MEQTATKMEKPVIVVGLDESDHSFYALEWTLNHFFVPSTREFTFKLVIVHAKPTPASAIGIIGPGVAGTVDTLLSIDSDLKKIGARILDKGKEMCISKSVNDVVTEVGEGDARYVLCEVVDKHHASMLVVGSHGYGAIQRAVLGSVSNYCVHHAHCSVMIVKRPQMKH